MDSMRSLNRSLPTSNRPSEELLRTFKAAAVSVTNIYREAVSGQTQARACGYQDALDDLLAFLDQQNLGLCDGEGWQVRQWATKRLEDRPTNQPNQDQQAASESEEEKEQDKEKSPSPVQPESSPIHQEPVQRLETPKPEDPTSKHQDAPKSTIAMPTSTVFTFESNHTYPHDVDMQSQDTTTTTATVRQESTPRSLRQSHKRNSKQGHRGVSARVLGTGGGTKRKFPYGEFFDISGIGDGKDNSRTPTKRGRMG